MTIADPYPTELDPFAAPDLQPISEVPLIAAVNRVATALEQIALALLDRPVGAQAPQVASQPTLAALPPVQPVSNGVCPIHNVPWKTVPAGVSKKNGQPYTAFQACSVSGCDQRPPR